MQTTTILYITLAAILSFGIAVFQYRKQNSKRRLYFIGLRFISLFAIILLIINPQFEKINIINEKPKLVVAIDNSESIKHLNFDKPVLDGIETLKNDIDLKDKFDIEYYTFAEALTANDSVSFTASQTNLAKTLEDISQIYRGEIAPIVLLSDGNQTYGIDYEQTSKQLQHPVFPVIMGDTITYSDLKIQQLNVNKYAYLNNKFPIEIITVYNGNIPVNSTLIISSENRILHRENLSFSKTQNSKTITITLPANTIGVQEYRAEITPLSTEKNKVNNVKPFAVEIIDQKTNVAIVTSTTHPDIGALKKAIESNQQRSVSIVSPNEFAEQNENFQLAILYQPDFSFDTAIKTIENSGANRFIIAGPKTEWSFLNDIQNAFSQDITSQTEEYLPSENPNFSTFIVNDLGFESFPPLLSDFGEITFNIPYETLLYKQVNNNQLNEPLLATFETESRREVVLFGEGLWRWRAQSFLNETSFQEFDDFIGKIVQYLASNKKRERLAVNYESFYNGNGNIKISAQFFNKNYEFDARASLSIQLKNTETDEEQLIPFVLRQNNYEVDLSGLPPAEYDFTVRANSSEATQSGRLRILDYNVEQQFLNANVTKLQATATNSNGKSYFSSDISKVSRDLLEDSRFVTLQRSTKNVVPLIDFEYVLALIALSLTIEWFLRKYNGLI